MTEQNPQCSRCRHRKRMHDETGCQELVEKNGRVVECDCKVRQSQIS